MTSNTVSYTPIESYKDHSHNYYLKNKDKWFEKKVCELCNSTYSRSTKFNHFKTKKHQINELKHKLEVIENKVATTQI